MKEGWHLKQDEDHRKINWGTEKEERRMNIASKYSCKNISDFTLHLFKVVFLHLQYQCFFLLEPELHQKTMQ